MGAGHGHGYLDYEGRRMELVNPFKIGRSKSNSLPIQDGGASREHALLVRNAAGDGWSLTDLNSTNGTFVNGKRVQGSVRLAEGDLIEIGSQCFRFHHSGTSRLDATTLGADKTILAIQASTRWLLLADIEGSTQLLKRYSQNEINAMVTRWVDAARVQIEEAGGSIETFTGDGFLAAWREDKARPEQVLGALERLHGLPLEEGLRFRMLLHFGVVQTGGAMASGIERLAGAEVNFVFKAEKAIARVSGRSVVTEAALGPLRDLLGEVRDLGAFAVPGFDGVFRFYEPAFARE